MATIDDVLGEVAPGSGPGAAPTEQAEPTPQVARGPVTIDDILGPEPIQGVQTGGESTAGPEVKIIVPSGAAIREGIEGARAQFPEEPTGFGRIVGEQGLVSRRTGLELVGGGLGAGVALIPPLAPLAPYAASAGAGLGAMVDAGLSAWEKSNTAERMTPSEIVWEVSKAGGETALLQHFGGKVLKNLGPEARAMFSADVKRWMPLSDALQKEAERQGIKLSTGQAWQFPGIAPFFRRLESGVLSSAPAKFAKEQVGEIKQFVVNQIDLLAPGYGKAARQADEVAKSGKPPVMGFQERMGESVKRGPAEVVLEEVRLGRKLFEGVDAVIDKEQVYQLPLIRKEAGRMVREQNERLGRRGMTLQKPEQLTVESTPAEVLGMYGANRGQMTWGQMSKLREALAEGAANHPDPVTRREFLSLHQKIIQEADGIAAGSPILAGPMERANRYATDKVEERFLRNETLANLNKTDASQLGGTLITPTKSIEEIRRLKKVLPKEKVAHLQAGWLDDLLENKAMGENGVFSPKVFVAELGKYRPEVLREVAGADVANALLSLRKTYLAIEATGLGAGNPKLLNQGMSETQMEQLVGMGLSGAAKVAAAGAAYMAGYNPVGLAAVTALGPAALTSLLYSKKGRELLTTGLKLSEREKKGAVFGTTILTTLARARGEEPWDEKGNFRGGVKGSEMRENLKTNWRSGVMGVPALVENSLESMAGPSPLQRAFMRRDRVPVAQ